MNAKEFWVTVVALAAIGTVSVLAYRHVTRPPADLCRVCQRGLHPAVAYTLQMGDGTRQRVCCPRCGMHLQIVRPGAVNRAWATDLNTGTEIPAPKATYVEGGDVAYCTMGEPPVRRAPEGVAEREYDRCLPTLVAFRTAEEAEAYRQQQGGRVLTYEQALQGVRMR